LALILVLAAFPLAVASTAGAAPGDSPRRMVCPASFQVLHDDGVDGLRLSAGAYRITVADPAKLDCARAAEDFSEFLRDFNGRLRRPWLVNAAKSTFQRGNDATISFSLARIGNAGGGGGNGNPTSNACPGFFSIQHDDHVGTLSLPKGRYRITLLNPKQLSCATAARRFTGFLEDYDGRLESPWLLANATGTFTRGKGSTTGFRVKPAIGREPRPGSGGRYPAKRQPGECPGSFRVLHRDRIGRVALPAGAYLTFPLRGSGLDCAGVSRLLRSFLARGGSLPRGWSVDPATGSFAHGKRPGFRVKPASPRVTTTPR
jgi:hypothetical protein